VDVVADEVGGLIVRAYLQSQAYGAADAHGKSLPKINNLTTIGMPNRGLTGVWNLLQDNWGANLDTLTFSLFLNLIYHRILIGGRVATPQGDISLADITTDGTISGTPSPQRFLGLYLRSLRDVLPTFAFLDDGSGNLTDINSHPDEKNTFLLDLNDGLDLLYAPGETVADRNPNRFVNQLLGTFTALYADTNATPERVTSQTGPPGVIPSISTLLGRTPAEDEIWFTDVNAPASGDGIVLKRSAIDSLPANGVNPKVESKLVTDFNSTGGTLHIQLLSNDLVLKTILTNSGREPLASDLSQQSISTFFVKTYRLLKYAILGFLQESQAGPGQPLTGAAVISLFQDALATITDLVKDQLASEAAPEGSTENGETHLIHFESETIPLIPLPLEPVLRVDGTTLELRQFTYDKSQKKFSGEVGLGADVIAFLPNSTTFRVTAREITGLLKFEQNTFQGFTLEAQQLEAQFKDLLRAGGKEVTIAPFADVVLSVGTLFGSIPRLGLTGNLFGLTVTNQGEFFATGFGVDVPEGVLKRLGLARFFPLDITGAEVKFAGDTDKDGFRDEGEVFDLKAFDLTVRGKFDATLFESFPFTPVIQVGEQSAAKAGDEISFTVTVEDGEVVPKTVGPIKLGVRDLKIGKLTLGATLTLGGYKEGKFNPDFSGFLKIESGLEKVTGESQVNVTGDFLPEQRQLKFAGEFSLGFELKNGAIKVDDATLDFGMVIRAGAGQNDLFTFEVTPPEDQPRYLDKLSVGLLQVSFGPFLTFQAKNTTLDFNATEREPLISFGGTPEEVNPEQSFSPASVTHGSLGAIFGPGAGPLQGWGGYVGNFAIGADLSFQPLPGFFVQLQVGPNPKFGLPSFLPVELKSVTMQFNEDAIQDGEVVQPANFSLIFSGGIKENTSWPIFGQFSGLKVNVEKLVQGDLANAIENLNGFAIGVRDVTLGGVKLSGSLGLGLVNVMLNGESQKAFYFRLGGQFFYSGIGGGIDIIFSQYGPILATISAGGLVEPTTGFVFGFKNAGFTFGGTPVPSIADAKELLTNPVFYSPVTIDLPEIERRVRSSVERGVPTWNDSFSLTATATVTNIYVQGMISGELTLAANIGLTGPNSGLKILGNGALSIMGFPLGNAAMLLDYSNPLLPRFDFAASLPAPNNPIGFLFPTNATLTATVDTKGIIELPIVGLGAFFKHFALGTLSTGQQFYAQTLSNLASNLEADHSLRLAQILLDIDGNGSVSATENSRVITAQFITDRTIGNATAGIPGILLTDFDALLALPPDQFASRVSRGAALIQELLPALINEADNLDAGTLLNALSGMLPVMQEAAVAGLAAGWSTFDPSVKLKGLIQPTLFGMPIGKPTQEVTVLINKSSIAFDYEGSLRNLIFYQQFGALLSALPPGLDGLNDQTVFSVRATLPGDLLSVLVTNLGRDPNGTVVTLPQFLLSHINPFRGWDVFFSSTVSYFGFKLGTVSGIIFGPQPTNTQGAFQPNGLFATRVVNLDPDGDAQPNPNLVDQITNGSSNLIPVNTKAQYENMMRYGGIALTGQLFMPEIIVDPIGVVSSINFTPPSLGFDLSNPFGNITTLPED
ncbi:MAG: hypothetical protein AB1813_23695, partial [Verrucomicrobiota bacterium]